MHIGILGTRFGKYHGHLYKKIDPAIQLTFWGRDAEKLRVISSELKCDYTTDLDKILDLELDYVDICLPSRLHTEYALKALDKNHSIFIETPAVTSLRDGSRIMELAKSMGKKALVNMFLRYDPYYRMIYDLSQSKKYGTLKHLSVFRQTPPIWGKLGRDNIATDLMIHDLDFVTWLSKDLKVDSFDVTTNADNTGAVLDCLLSNDSAKIHVRGNSMLALGSPFIVGYEATFERAFVSYYEKSSEDGVDSLCYLYSDGRKEKVTLVQEEHCLELLRAAIKDFSGDIVSGLGIENALPALSIAFKLSKSI